MGEARPRGRSKAAIGVAAVYALLSLAAAALPLLAKEDESLAGIFLVLLALPWTLALGWLTERWRIDSLSFNYVFLLIGIFVNSIFLYWTVSSLSRWWNLKTSD